MNGGTNVRMKSGYIFVLIITILFVNACVAKDSVDFFNINVGDKPDELGVIVGKGEIRDSGPTGIASHNNIIYILDEVNLRINMYTKGGKFIKNIPLREELLYYDLSVSPEGKIILLTDDGIYLVEETMEKIYDIPDDISVPYYFSSINSKLGNIIFSGLCKNGRLKIGVIDRNGSYKYLEGFRIISNNSDLVGVQTSNTNVDVYRDEIKVNSIKISKDMYPIGLTDEKNILCLQPNSDGFKIIKIRNDERIAEKYLPYNLTFQAHEKIEPMKYFRVTNSDEIIILETSSNEVKVLIIHF